MATSALTSTISATPTIRRGGGPPHCGPRHGRRAGVAEGDEDGDGREPGVHRGEVVEPGPGGEAEGGGARDAQWGDVPDLVEDTGSGQQRDRRADGEPAFEDAAVEG